MSFKFRVGAVSFNRFRVGAVGFWWLGFFYFYFLGGDDWATQNGILSDCIPQWFEGSVSVLCNPNIWQYGPSWGLFWFSTELAGRENMTFERKHSRSRKARQSIHNILKIVFHTWLVYYQVPLMIGEIPISDACQYGCTWHQNITVVLVSIKTAKRTPICIKPLAADDKPALRPQLMFHCEQKGPATPRRGGPRWNWHHHG